MELLDTSANPQKLHRQAKKILRNTSRAKNPDWYRRANELAFQWHIWVGAGQIVSTIYNSAADQWFEGPALPRLSFEEEEATGEVIDLDEESRNALHELVRGILASKDYGAKAKSLGIVMHLADGLRVRELDPQFASEKDFDSVQELLLSAPDIALGDDSVASEVGLWRLLPLFGKDPEEEKLAVAVQVTENFRYIADAFRHYGEMRNIPVVAEVLSAALEGLAGLPELLPEAGKLDNTLSLLQFEAFTLLCATGRKGELQMIRPLPHRVSNSLSATEIADYVTQTAALLDLKTPRVMLISMAGMLQEELEKLLLIYREMNPEAELHAINTNTLPYAEKIPGARFEIALSTGNCETEVDKETPLYEAREKWATQNFNAPSSEERRKMPTRGDLRLLKFAGLAQKLAIIAFLGLCGWTGTEYFSKLKSEAWNLEETAASEMKMKLAQLQKERNEWEYYNNLFVERSEGWLAMEALLGIFPEKGGVLLKNASYSAGSISADEKAEKAGIKRSWQISGYANPEVAKNLPSLGSKTKVAELLDRIAKENDAPYLAVDSDTRSVEVKLEQKRGTMPSSTAFPTRVARYFRTAFDLDISQSFAAEDALALNLPETESK